MSPRAPGIVQQWSHASHSSLSFSLATLTSPSHSLVPQARDVSMELQSYSANIETVMCHSLELKIKLTSESCLILQVSYDYDEWEV